MSLKVQEAINKVLGVGSRIRYPAVYRMLWVLAARLSVTEYPEKTFTMEEVREWTEVLGLPEVPDARAWGGITRVLKHKGLIVETGEKKRVKYINRNSQLVKVWKHN